MSDTATKMQAIIQMLGDKTPPAMASDASAEAFWARGANQKPAVLENGRAMLEDVPYITLQQIVQERERIVPSDTLYSRAYGKWYRRITRHADTIKTRFHRAIAQNGRECLLLFVEQNAYESLVERLYDLKDFETCYQTAIADGAIVVSQEIELGECLSFKDATLLFNLCGTDASEMSLRTAYFQDRLAGKRRGSRVFLALEDTAGIDGLRSYFAKFVPRIKGS